MTLKADLDRLRSLGGELHGLAGEAMTLSSTSGQTGATPCAPSWEQAVTEAGSIATEIVSGALIPGIRERLSETGDVMINVAKQFANTDNANERMIATLYSGATGDWNVTDPS